MYAKWKKNKDDQESIGQTTGSGTNDYKIPTPTNPSPDFKSLPTGSFPIKYGSKSKLVYLLQSALNKLYNAGLTLDGDFGEKTKTALKSAYGIEQVDFKTAKKIYLSVFAKSKSDASLESLINTMDLYMKF